MKPFAAALAIAMTGLFVLSDVVRGETLDSRTAEAVGASHADAGPAPRQETGGERNRAVEWRQAVRVILQSPYTQRE